jgi:hypothetical protein
MSMKKYVNKCQSIVIYEIVCTKGYQMAECQTNFSLKPWGENTTHYEGHDDGGVKYDLPEGFELAETVDGTPAIYRGKEHFDLTTNYGRPMITNGWDSVVLVKSNIQ